MKIKSFISKKMVELNKTMALYKTDVAVIVNLRQFDTFGDFIFQWQGPT